MKPFLHSSVILLCLSMGLFAQEMTHQMDAIELLNQSFQKAKQWEQSGSVDSASVIIDAVLARKSLLLNLLDSMEFMESRILSQRSPQSKELQAWLKMVENLQKTHSDYRIMRPYLDSLRRFNRNDSIWLWCAKQEQIAIERTQLRIVSELKSMQKNATLSGSYNELRGRLPDLLALPSELSVGLGLDTLEAWIDQSEIREQTYKDSAFWSTHDPVTVMHDVEKYLGQGKFVEARSLTLKLMSTTQRTKALSLLPSLSEKGCATDRKVGADLFAKWKKQHKIQDLQGALAALERCLQNFPEHPQANTLRRNKELIESEIPKEQP